ncbi:HhH-GPD-type base excision DNA repair protein [Auritidibacter ignavus]|uniref:HhH-GPD-type base excision DNA repair protein n=1 Tax=Auritidibacter ignavus TaxID=678932 RepID=A0AAJ6AJ82_9MICC|nr:HhH-GPD-type base excision DNA repair protein [Auritidibacter ignavus]PXA76925.1 Fe-S cluster assembly protein HesB [Auritidibacter sp. NML120779]WGH93229.1 HhH-GPD-type base excision DNA repair protein [Auritidibacter ignavus]
MSETVELHLSQNESADRLLSSNPLALMIGMLLDQQVSMELAFAGPEKIADRTGVMEAEALASYDPDELVEVFQQSPAVHRFPGSMATRVQKFCRVIADEYEGDASAIWTQGDPDGATVLKRLKKLPGYGDQKAKIFLALLGKQLGFSGSGWREASGEYGDPEAMRSVADIYDEQSLAAVRETKKVIKATAKKKKQDTPD